MGDYQQCPVCKSRYAMWYTECPSCKQKLKEVKKDG